MPWGAFPALLSGRAGAGGPVAPALSHRGRSGGARVLWQAVDRRCAALELAHHSQKR